MLLEITLLIAVSALAVIALGKEGNQTILKIAKLWKISSDMRSGRKARGPGSKRLAD
jgi:hypothetical protein